MKKIIILSLAIVLTSTVTIAQEEIKVPLSSPGGKSKIDVDIKYGSITIKGVDRKDVLIRYTVIKSDKDQEKTTKNGLKRIPVSGIDLDISENQNSVRVNSDSWSTKMDVAIEVPTKMDVKADTYNSGDINISNIEGEVILENYNGSISAENIKGSVIADTYNGDINVIFDEVRSEAPLSYITYNGDVDITFPSSYSANLKAKSERGDVYSAFEFEMIETEPKKTVSKNGTYKVEIDKWTSAKINGGGPELLISTYNGDIYLRK